MPLEYLQRHFLRCLAELNRSNWFCRPVPNLPAQAPKDYKGKNFYGISKPFRLSLIIILPITAFFLHTAGPLFLHTPPPYLLQLPSCHNTVQFLHSTD